MTKRLLITGGCGVIGTILKGAFGHRYEISCLDTRKSDNRCVVGDVAKFDEISPHFVGMDVVIHLAGDSRLEADWDSVYRNNILGTYNVFEAARMARVQKIIFTSSNHVTGLYENDWPISAIVRGEYSGLRRDEVEKVSHISPPKADSFYGASKLFGEGLGQYYSANFGMSVICLRIGTVKAYEWPKPDEIRFFSTWMSHRDFIQLVEKCLEKTGVVFDVFYGVSNNAWRFWDISHPREVVGYEPLDNAADHTE